jgi:hypothetical protein
LVSAEGEEPVGGVAGAERVVVGEGGGVLVGGREAVMGGEEVREGGGVVGGAAGLAVEVVGEGREGEGEEKSEDLRGRREFKRAGAGEGVQEEGDG